MDSVFYALNMVNTEFYHRNWEIFCKIDVLKFRPRNQTDVFDFFSTFYIKNYFKKLEIVAFTGVIETISSLYPHRLLKTMKLLRLLQGHHTKR